MQENLEIIKVEPTIEQTVLTKEGKFLYILPNLKGKKLIEWNNVFDNYIETLKEKKWEYTGVYKNATTFLEHYHITGDDKEKHSFLRKPCHVINNNLVCPDCRNKKDKDIGEEEIEQIIKDKGGILKSKYKNISTLNDIICKNNHPLKISLYDLKRGRWCKDCYYENIEDNYFNALKKINSISLDGYKGSKVRLRHQCPENHVWTAYSSQILAGQTCTICSGYDRETCIMQFYMILAFKNGEALEEYKNRHTQILLRCNTCTNEWKVTPNCIMKGHWCSICAGKNSQQAEEKFYKNIKEKNGIVLGKYINSYTHVLVKCYKGHTWPVKPYNITSGKWCSGCYGNSKEEARKKLQGIIDHEKGKLLTPYNGKRSPITLEHQRYNEKLKKNVTHTWTTIAENIFQGCWCPFCRESSGEKEIRLFLEENDIKYDREYPVKINNCRYRFDFFLQIDNKVIIIEYDGEQHFELTDFFHSEEEFKKQQISDFIKTKWAIDNNIFILRIDYLNFDNIRDILLETLSDIIFCEYAQEKLDISYLILNDNFNKLFIEHKFFDE